MGGDNSKRNKNAEKLKESVIKIMYVTDHGCESVTVQSLRDIILKICDVVSLIPCSENLPVPIILKILTFIVNETKTASNDEVKLLSLLKTVLAEEKITGIQNYFQSLNGYLRNHYPYVQGNNDKIQQLNAEVKTVREHCTTLHNTMRQKTNIPIDSFWFFVSSLNIHLLLLKELITLGSLQRECYNAYANEYCQMIDQLKLKIMNPDSIRFEHSVDFPIPGPYVIPKLKSHDGKVYKILEPSKLGYYARFEEKDYINQIKAWAQEYYDDQMGKIHMLVENINNSRM